MYVSCRYAPPAATGLMPEAKEGEKPVICTDENGTEWFLTENSEVGDWLRYDGTIEPYVPPPEAKPAKKARKKR